MFSDDGIDSSWLCHALARHCKTAPANGAGTSCRTSTAVAAALTSRGASKDLQATSAIAGRKWMLLLACLPAFYNLLYLSGALWLDFLPFLDSLCSLTAILLHVMLTALPSVPLWAAFGHARQPSTWHSYPTAVDCNKLHRSSQQAISRPCYRASTAVNGASKTQRGNQDLRRQSINENALGNEPGPRSEVRGPRSEVRGPRSEVRGPRSEVRGPRSEVRGPRSEVRGPRSEVRGPRSEVPGPRSEVRGPRSEVRGPRSEVRGPRSEVRGPRSEVRDPRSEVRGPRFEVRGPRSEVRDPRSEIRGPRPEVRDPEVCRSDVWCEARGSRSETCGSRINYMRSKVWIPEVRDPRSEVVPCPRRPCDRRFDARSPRAEHLAHSRTSRKFTL